MLKEAAIWIIIVGVIAGLALGFFLHTTIGYETVKHPLRWVYGGGVAGLSAIISAIFFVGGAIDESNEVYANRISDAINRKN